MIGAVPSRGWPRRILLLIALLFGVAAAVYWFAQWGSPAAMAVVSLIGLSPIIAVLMVMILTVQRELPPKPPKVTTPPEPPKLNPALTADYLNGLVERTTELDAKRKITALKNQLARLKGEVSDVSEDWRGEVCAEILGLQMRDEYGDRSPIYATFKSESREAMEAVKAGDWIEFQGEVQHSGSSGWCIVRADFLGRAEPPPPPKKARVPRRAS